MRPCEVLGNIADNLHDAGWSLRWVSALDRKGRTIRIVDAHRDDGRRFIVHADEKLSAFGELESAIKSSLRIALTKRRNFRKLGVAIRV